MARNRGIAYFLILAATAQLPLFSFADAPQGASAPQTPQYEAAAQAYCRQARPPRSGETTDSASYRERFADCVSRQIAAQAEKRPETKKNTECNEANAVNYNACRATEKAIQESATRSQAMQSASQSVVTTVAGVESMRSKGTAEDSQKAVGQIANRTALAKIADASVKLYGSSELLNSSRLSEKEAKELKEHGDAMRAKCSKEIDEYAVTADGSRRKIELRQTLSQCFSSVSGKTVDYAATDNLAKRLTNAKDETSAQSQAAKNAAIQQGLGAGADALMAFQAMQIAKSAGKNATDMRSLTPPSYRFNPGGGASSKPGGKSELPDDLGIEAPGGSFLSGDGARGVPDRGGPGGVLAPATPFRGSKSTVTGGGGAGGASGRGGAPGRGGKAGSRPGPQKIGNLDYGNGMGGGGARGAVSSTQAPDTSLMDAMKCLVDPANCKAEGQAVVLQGEVRAGGDARLPASEGDGGESADLSIFEQISAKYRALAARGSI